MCGNYLNVVYVKLGYNSVNNTGPSFVWSWPNEWNNIFHIVDYKKGPFTKLKWWNHYLTQMTNSIDDNYHLENKIFRMYSTEREGTHPIMTVDHLHAFLQDYQKEHFTKEQSRIIILKHLIGEDAINKPSERPDCWLSKEFSGYLFSEENDLMDPAKSVVYQDMTKPLSEYWINSSHNTYLSGAQFMAKADTMAYSTTLR